MSPSPLPLDVGAVGGLKQCLRGLDVDGDEILLRADTDVRGMQRCGVDQRVCARYQCLTERDPADVADERSPRPRPHVQAGQHVPAIRQVRTNRGSDQPGATCYHDPHPRMFPPTSDLQEHSSASAGGPSRMAHRSTFVNGTLRSGWCIVWRLERAELLVPLGLYLVQPGAQGGD